MPHREYFFSPTNFWCVWSAGFHVSLWDAVGGVVVRVTSDIWTSCQPEPLEFAAPYWGTFTSDGEENILRYWLSPKTSTSLGSHLMQSSVWTEEKDGLLAYFAQAVCWLYCKWRQLQPGGGMTCCFVHIYTTSPAVSIWFCIFSLKKIRQIKTIWLLQQKAYPSCRYSCKKKGVYTYNGKEICFSYTVANQITFEGKIYLIPLPSTVAAKISHKLVLTLNNIT